MDPRVMREKFETLLGITELVESSSGEKEAIEAVVLNVGELGYPNVSFARFVVVNRWRREWNTWKLHSVQELHTRFPPVCATVSTSRGPAATNGGTTRVLDTNDFPMSSWVSIFAPSLRFRAVKRYVNRR